MASKKLSNLQLELLELYAMQISEEELKDIKKLLSLFYAQKAITAADEVWTKKGLSEKVMENWMKEKMRTPSQDQKKN